MIEVREPQRIAEEEHRRVVADDVPVTLLGIELEGGTADIAFRIGRAALAGDGREPHEHRRLLADLRENLGLGVAADVVSYRERAVGSPAFGVHAPLRDHLPVEMRQLLDQPYILEQRRPRGPAVMMLVLSATGAPVALENRISVDMVGSWV